MPTSGMNLGLLTRLRVEGSRQLFRWARRTPWVRSRLLARRASDIAQGLDPDLAIMLELAEVTGDASAARGDPTFARRRTRYGVAIASAPPAGDVAISERTVDASARPIPARLYVPSMSGSAGPGVVFVHGGGWVTGDLDTHDTWCRRLALVGRLRVLAIAPRLAPEDPFPASLDDTLAAFRYVAHRPDAFGIDPQRLGICGDSAGGNLSAIVSLETRGDAVRPRVTGLFYPWLDATLTQPSIRTRRKGYFLDRASLDWYLGYYIGKDEGLRNNPRASPLHSSDLSGAPRTLVAVADFDPLVDEGVLYAQRLREAGTQVALLRYPSLIHGFLLMTAISPAALASAHEVARRMGEMLRE